MKKTVPRLWLLVLVGIHLGVVGACADITSFYLTSQPGSWVGQGETVLITAESDFTIARLPVTDTLNRILFQVDNFAFFPPSDPRWKWWVVDFSAPYGTEKLQVGRYENSWVPGTRPSENRDLPGLDLYGNTRGYNTVMGEFEVLELISGEDGQLQSFAADFRLFDGHGLEGAIRYNSSIPIPEPSSWILGGSFSLLLAIRWRRRGCPPSSDVADRPWNHNNREPSGMGCKSCGFHPPI